MSHNKFIHKDLVKYLSYIRFSKVLKVLKLYCNKNCNLICCILYIDMHELMLKSSVVILKTFCMC